MAVTLSPHPDDRPPPPPATTGVLLAALVALASWAAPVVTTAGRLQVTDLTPAAAASINAVARALALRRARRSPEESGLWRGLM